MIKSRDQNIVVKSQFNIHGSRGKDAGKFIADYVSRESATDPSQAYRPDPNRIPKEGDGVAFTLDETAITRDATLDVAEHVQDLHATGRRAIQQMIVSLSPDYLVKERLVPEDLEVLHKGDYRYEYDDVRLRHAVQHGLQSLIDVEGYRNGKAIACIQRDTRHLHVHAVVYEDAHKISRMRGKEEKGVIKNSSFNMMAHDIDRHLELTKMPGLIPNAKNLFPEPLKAPESSLPTSHVIPDEPVMEEPVYVNEYLRILQQQKQEKKAQQLAHKIIDRNGHIHDDRDVTPEMEEATEDLAAQKQINDDNKKKQDDEHKISEGQNPDLDESSQVKEPSRHSIIESLHKI